MVLNFLKVLFFISLTRNKIVLKLLTYISKGYEGDRRVGNYKTFPTRKL